MCRKLIFLISFVLVPALVGGASADITNWTNDDPDTNSWCEKNNWDNGKPGSGDTAVLATPERGPIIGTEICGDVTVGTIKGPAWGVNTAQVMDINTSGTVEIGEWARDEAGSGTVTVNINGSPTIEIGGLFWRLPDNGVGIVNISGEPNIIVDNQFRGADLAGTFIVNMSGGRLECTHLIWGDNGGGELNLSGGSIIISDDLQLGELRGAEPITINMTGGLITVDGTFECPSNAGRAGVVTVNLDAGVIDCNEFVHGSIIEGQPSFTDDWHVSIEEGVLKIGGDVTAAIDANVAAGQISAYDYDGTVNVELIDGNTVVTGLPPDPNTATKPNPLTRSENVEPDVVLSWTSGIYAATVGGHDVYFGTDFEDVNEGSGGTFMGNQDSNTFNTVNYDPSGLEFETTYYWRIDEVNVVTWTGRVWYFTTSAFIPDPNLLIWYKLDECAPNTVAYDSSGHGNDGAVSTGEDTAHAAWDPDGHDGGCLWFDDDTVVQPASTVLSNIDKGITFSVWLKDPYKSGADNWVFDTGSGQTAPCHVHASVPDAGGRDVYWRAGDDTNDVLKWTDGNPADWRDRWRHFAFVKDENAGKMWIYYEGNPVAEKTDVSADTLAGIQNKAFKIGSSTWISYDYKGAMDDFRVYDRALSATEIGCLFRGGGLGVAWNPEPANGAKDLSRDVVLTWKPGNYAQDVNAHEVYFGTSFNDVNDANDPNVLPGRGRQGPCSYDPGLLDLDTTYYWRIDEVNDANADSPWKGDVWRFTVANFLIVDNMEDYNDFKPDRIYDTWHDWEFYDPVGGKYPTSAELTLETAEADVHSGRQSMKFQYNNSDIGAWMFYRNISEIDANTIGPLMHLEIGQDWTILDMKILTLHFIGHPDNDATEQMYVALADSAGRTAVVPYGYYIDEDINNIKRREWQEWNIELQDFNDVNDVNLTDVNNVYIGFGNRDNPVVGGSGVVFFDDIRLYSRKCIASRRQPASDLSNNCIVGLEDIEIMADQWLRSDANLLPVVDPGITGGLVGHWELDGNANDSVGTNHGTVEGDYLWVSGHIGTGALEFNGLGGRVMVPDAAVLRPTHTVSVSAWVYHPATQATSSCVVVKGKNDAETYQLNVSDKDTVTFNIRDVNGVKYAVEKGNIWPNEWLHIAGTYDGSVQKSYVNGQVVDSSEEPNNILLSQDTEGLAIGNRDAMDSAFIGTIDDVRVYNRSLLADEVEYLASEGTGYVALTSPANIYDVAEEIEGQYRQVINFRDYAKLTDTWLEEKLYPPEP